MSSAKRAKAPKARIPNKPRRSRLDVLVLGLGNPGTSYAATRHNVGFHVIDKRVASRNLRLRRRTLRAYAFATERAGGSVVSLVKPLTYMNRSGQVVPAVQRRFRPERIVVVCDNLDLPPGALRLKRGGSGGGHRGLESIARYLAPEQYLRLYVGIGRPGGIDGLGGGTHDGNREEIVGYVLGEPGEAERQRLEAATSRAAEFIDLFPTASTDELIQRINSSN
ncbi:MAG: aminoacyl-tRNA hydrolase [Spirochaetaceae bacterium]